MIINQHTNISVCNESTENPLMFFQGIQNTIWVTASFAFEYPFHQCGLFHVFSNFQIVQKMPCNFGIDKVFHLCELFHAFSNF